MSNFKNNGTHIGIYVDGFLKCSHHTKNPHFIGTSEHLLNLNPCLLIKHQALRSWLLFDLQPRVMLICILLEKRILVIPFRLYLYFWQVMEIGIFLVRKLLKHAPQYHSSPLWLFQATCHCSAVLGGLGVLAGVPHPGLIPWAETNKVFLCGLVLKRLFLACIGL